MKPAILTFTHYYLPGYKSGGPVRTIANMVDHLSDHFDFRIVTTDRDTGDTGPYPGVRVDGWNTVGRAQVYYASPGQRTFRTLARLIRETPHDVLYVNSFFDWRLSLQPLVARHLGLTPARPAVIAPRGEFSPGAMELKRWKKASYMAFVRAIGIPRGLTWQASSEHEAADIRRAMGRRSGNVVAAPNLTPVSYRDTSEIAPVVRQNGGALRLCFLSRVSPKKNVDYALKVLRGVTVPVVFDIYGGINDEAYWRYCQRIAAQLPDHIQVRWRGIVNHNDVPGALAQHDLFFLPTRGENYGHAIHEALAAGVPVLISDQTPWRGLDALGVGWEIPLTHVDRFRAVIEHQARLSPEALQVQRLKAVEYARTISRDGERVAQNRVLFQDLLG